MEPVSRAGRGVAARQDLMDVAIDCFARHGYQATSIDRIARAAGVTKGALYYHFADKEQLLLEAVASRIGQFEHRVSSELARIDDPAAALRRLAAICAEHATRSNHRRLIVTLMVEALDTHPRLSAEFRAMMQRFRAFVAALVRRGQARQRFRAPVDPDTAAAVWTGGVMGIELQHYQDPERFDLAAALGAFVDQYVAWLTGPAAAAAGRRRRASTRRTAWSASSRAKTSN